ncbi:serine/threonine protein kinase [Pseudomonas stutzeri]|uniref:Serine/threonine protein kinase n=1 Tax=Stutzerimonas stutzeri TaxID=316 RepID=A0A2N8SUV6_STUST|nr:lipopolysaccharide kinase InaA family protein [Stutzerimonas stutzeri]EQM73763.1 serine/threonine protein kinase [Stutzerimonas stutzeri MF28]MCQ4249242.1 serine/threonine protein kinase [Stutzerimonas stutzeri]PNG06239.1 serine/threonine protein kinase [Stutzerimonas stutzeri]
MRLSELATCGRQPSLPLTVDVGEAGDLVVEQWLRVLPGQRYVGRAQWQGRTVLAKLMVGGNGHRHYLRERDGAALLIAQDLATPGVLAEGWRAGEGGWLLFEFLDDARSLWDAWRECEHAAPLTEGQAELLGAALGLIAQMHSRGLWQEDLHLDNLLLQTGVLHVVDGGGVRAETPGQPLSRERVLANLGVFFAQLPTTVEPFIEELLVHYLLANSEHALPLEALLKELRKVRAWRLNDFLKKVARDCSLFSARIGAFGARVVRRDAQARLQNVLDDPDEFIARGHLYKTGGAATVARIEVDGQPLLIKRYNIKSPLHWCKRFWRPSRAWHSWVEGNRLDFLGIATPRLLSVIERRWLWLRGPAWLITELLGGEDIIARFQPYLNEAPPEDELAALDRLFAALIRERISHGDLKGHNLFWEQGRWALIDLDAVQQHSSDASFARAYAKDRARFLRNWPTDSALHRLLDERLPRDSLRPNV